MGGRNKIDIVRTLGDKLVIDFLQAFVGNFLAEAFTADVIVLAENTVQVAAGKENRTAAFSAADDGLIPHMQAGAGNNRSEADAAAAEAACSIRHICRAVIRRSDADIHNRESYYFPPLKRACRAFSVYV